MRSLADLGFLLIGGAGKIGSAISRGMVGSGKVTPDRLVITARHPSSIEAATERGLPTSLDNARAYTSLGQPVVILCVHPDEALEVLARLDRGVSLAECPLVISIVTGIDAAAIGENLPPSVPVVRAMPNLPARVRQAATVISTGPHAGAEHLAIATEIFETIGRVVELDEKHLNAATGLAGCGPAFVFQILEALAHGGVQVGLPRHAARLLAAQTVYGAAQMVLETGEHPAVLKDEVTTPGGCTVAALTQLEMLGLKSALIQAVETATARAAQLGGDRG